MKRLYLLPLVCAVLLAGCKEQLWDYPNEEISITVVNAQGKDLLFEENDGDILGNNISIDYNGKNYTRQPYTRAAVPPNPPKWKGFRVKTSIYTHTKGALVFGEFSVDTKGYRGESFTINWGDGTTSEVTFDLYATSNGKKKEPTIHRSIWLDGELQSDQVLAVEVTAGAEGVGK